MRLVILAAGRGERLLPLTRNTPKPLLDMGNGRTLLEEQLESVQRSGAVDEVVLVIGYLAGQVEAKMQYYRSRGYRIRTIFNPFYLVSNNLMSLWLAKSVFEEGDAMVTNGDNLFTPDVFADFAAQNGDGIFLAVGGKQAFDFDDMKVALDDGSVARVSKQLEDAEAHAESPGLALVRGTRARGLFVEHLEALARAETYIDKFWLEVFNHLYAKGVQVKPWFFPAREKWQEVDFHPDVGRVRSLLESRVRG